MPAIVAIQLPKTIGSPDSVALGQFGADWFDDSADHTGGDWGMITVLADATFTVLETSTICLNGVAPTNLNGKIVTRGINIYGRFTRIQLASGSIIAYRATAMRVP